MHAGHRESPLISQARYGVSPEPLRAETVMTDRVPKWKPRTLAAQMLGMEEPTTRGVVAPVHEIERHLCG